MAELHAITPLLTEDYKTVRLRALKDAPLSCGSTYERELQLTDQDWLARATRLTNGRDIGFLARTDGKWSGLALCLILESDATRGELISMWVAPEARRLGVGRQLIRAIEQWALSHGVKTLKLMVTSVNLSALDFYHSLGFAKTGRIEPYPNDSAIDEHEMTKAI